MRNTYCKKQKNFWTLPEQKCLIRTRINDNPPRTARPISAAQGNQCHPASTRPTSLPGEGKCVSQTSSNRRAKHRLHRRTQNHFWEGAP